jgi:hypothetical protein
MTVLENMQAYEDIVKITRSSKKSYSADKKIPLVLH